MWLRVLPWWRFSKPLSSGLRCVGKAVSTTSAIVFVSVSRIGEYGEEVKDLEGTDTILSKDERNKASRHFVHESERELEGRRG